MYFIRSALAAHNSQAGTQIESKAIFLKFCLQQNWRKIFPVWGPSGVYTVNGAKKYLLREEMGNRGERRRGSKPNLPSVARTHDENYRVQRRID